ncbi:GNAT family N-acetyltransferase [Dermatobacter hominis]|uniref:GNAT family N-acetyltransferase n=1 Tax=Dermatobacter hominis TaxID=2884263 RepID=UPI001D123CB5|nr:GNAT family N-acetyltransferase [Dermatobacter hominis]UDY34271.1 GNAT family N-acetyltransferase [Dermatobacter hominis]
MMQFDPVLSELTALAERRLADPRPTTRPTVRPISADDARALAEMALRCSPDSLRHRFHAPVQHLDPDRLVALLRGGTVAETLVADVDGAIVGIATLHRTGDDIGEIAVLVEDHWQAGGLGSRLIAHLMRRAGQRGITTIDADVQREQGFVIDRLLHAVDGTTVTFDGPTATVHVPVPAALQGHPGAPGGGPVATAS